MHFLHISIKKNGKKNLVRDELYLKSCKYHGVGTSIFSFRIPSHDGNCARFPISHAVAAAAAAAFNAASFSALTRFRVSRKLRSR